MLPCSYDNHNGIIMKLMLERELVCAAQQQIHYTHLDMALLRVTVIATAWSKNIVQLSFPTLDPPTASEQLHRQSPLLLFICCCYTFDFNLYNVVSIVYKCFCYLRIKLMLQATQKSCYHCALMVLPLCAKLMLLYL